MNRRVSSCRPALHTPTGLLAPGKIAEDCSDCRISTLTIVSCVVQTDYGFVVAVDMVCEIENENKDDWIC